MANKMTLLSSVSLASICLGPVTDTLFAYTVWLGHYRVTTTLKELDPVQFSSMLSQEPIR
ncbi:hypothetical protein BO86DRAFT_387950 [Aspergillus japonicus CBS 114.51]|uniref:Uncharacterized protein n=2 Tax=Aspergillus TaxID=5052 RepID=A0A2V5HLF4_ASPV1|nr:hypothetical protein BO86DRAFT_387950 [Aspergillus japonicus CBS 114.51]PYI23392.1 hypothetical protein BO99DRAFT_399336 [Aspergillus violaceofuscus CBS 115571]RAH83351.1 hypothetical protein BO86DRAFT_387950 [Aspergillus japonicus CBS 114.51]